MKNPFSKEITDMLFECNAEGELKVPESYDIEYKENFNISDDLIKAINGLANNRGGYIIFGVSPSNKKMIGLKEEKINIYLKNIDSESMRGRILSACQPNLEYKHYLHNVGISKFILFYIEESKSKPHVFLNSSEEIIQGDIYYRYNDSIKKIQYAELNSIIENKRVKEQEKWMIFLGEIAKIGLDDVLIIDSKSGKLLTSNIKDGNIIIDESVLSKFKLVKEGQFKDIDGDPTLKLIGNINFVNESGKYELTDDYSAILDPNSTHPYRFSDIIRQMENEQIKTSDDILITPKNVHYSRVRYFIINNKLDQGIENIYMNKYDMENSVKKFSHKVYNLLKEAFSKMSLSEINQIRENKNNE